MSLVSGQLISSIDQFGLSETIIISCYHLACNPTSHLVQSYCFVYMMYLSFLFAAIIGFLTSCGELLSPDLNKRIMLPLDSVLALTSE